MGWGIGMQPIIVVEDCWINNKGMYQSFILYLQISLRIVVNRVDDNSGSRRLGEKKLPFIDKIAIDVPANQES